ncbi:Kelch repeat-containing protein 2 [Diplonema papillatum]|nr:Kelch repeat-containing protein 2 [Diplonema papillatum]
MRKCFWTHLRDSDGTEEPGRGCCHSAVWDAENEELVVFGGGVIDEYRREAYAFSVKKRVWRKLPVVNQEEDIPAVMSHTAVITHDGKMVVFGGLSTDGCQDGTYVLNLRAEPLRWKKMQTTGKYPSARKAHASVLVGDTMWVFFGADSFGACFGDVLKLDLTSWKWSEAVVHADVVREKFSVYPPFGVPSQEDEERVAKGESALSLQQDGAASSLAGGIEKMNVTNTMVHTASASAGGLKSQSPGGTPVRPRARWGHSVARHAGSGEHLLYLFGGLTTSSQSGAMSFALPPREIWLSDLWVLNIHTNQWRLLHPGHQETRNIFRGPVKTVDPPSFVEGSSTSPTAAGPATGGMQPHFFPEEPGYEGSEVGPEEDEPEGTGDGTPVGGMSALTPDSSSVTEEALADALSTTQPASELDTVSAFTELSTGNAGIDASSSDALMNASTLVDDGVGDEDEGGDEFQNHWVSLLDESGWYTSPTPRAEHPAPPVGRVPQGRYSQLCWAASGGFYVFGGDTMNCSKYFNDLWRYDLAAGGWEMLKVPGDVPSPRSGHVGLPVAGSLLVFGGETPAVSHGWNTSKEVSSVSYSAGVYVLPHYVDQTTTLASAVSRQIVFAHLSLSKEAFAESCRGYGLPRNLACSLMQMKPKTVERPAPRPFLCTPPAQPAKKRRRSLALSPKE